MWLWGSFQMFIINDRDIYEMDFVTIYVIV